MFCSNCGNEIKENSNVCDSCNSPVNNDMAATMHSEGGRSGYSENYVEGDIKQQAGNIFAEIKDIIKSTINDPINSPTEKVNNISKNTVITIISATFILTILNTVIFSSGSFGFLDKYLDTGLSLMDILSSVIRLGISLALGFLVLYLLVDANKKVEFGTETLLKIMVVSYLPALAIEICETILSFIPMALTSSYELLSLVSVSNSLVGSIGGLGKIIFGVVLFNIINNNELTSRNKAFITTLAVCLFI